MTAYSPQPAIVGVPVAGSSPVAYASGALAYSNLTTRYSFIVPAFTSIPDALVVVASMMVDMEGPFEGVKIDPVQERSWPRTYKYGWPNIISAPAATMVTRQFPGAWYLDYEGVVPQQILDWVSLQCYRLITFPLERQAISESVTGAAIHYSPAAGEKGWIPSMLDEIMYSLIQPFQMRVATQAAFTNFRTL